MSQPTDRGQPPSAAKDHEQPTVVDVRAGPPPNDDSRVFLESAADINAGAIPSRVGEYELLREIGRGGMGVVYQARHQRLGRLVALKMILGGALAPPEDLQRFDTEIAAAAQLQHPNIVALYEVSTQPQQPYFSMEYISGVSLAQRLALGPMANRRAVAYLEAVARAVHHAHVRGIVHRDLKPANILLDEHDQPKVTDFGLAKLLATDSGQTRTGTVLGTPSYMSPEQAAGERAIGPASDVWSLGAIFYELLTGRPPFRGETAMATLQQVAHQDPIPPRMFDETIDPALETICLKCLEKEPGRRYYSAEALADDLRRFLNEEPILARRVPAIARMAAWCRRKPALAALSGSLLVLFAGLLIFLFIAQREERQLRGEAEAAQRIALAREGAMRHLLYTAELRRAQAFLEQADFEQVERLLQRWAPREGQPDLRDWEWYFLKRHSEGRHTVRAHPYQASAVAWRPDGKQFATAGGEPGKPGQIKLWVAATGKLVATLEGHDLAITSLAWHPTQEVLASGSFDRTVRLWNPAEQKELARLTGHRAAVTSVAFAPGGDYLASASRDKTARLWNVADALAGMSEATVLAGHQGEVTAVAFGPGRELLATASADSTVRVWSMATKQVQRVLTGHEGPVECLAFSPRGGLLACGGGAGFQRGAVKIWNAATGAELVAHFGLSDTIKAIAVNEAEQIAAAGKDGLIHVWDRTRTSEGVVFRGDKQLLGLAFSPDGRRLAAAGASGRVNVFNTSGSLETTRLNQRESVEAIAFHPDVPLLAVAGAQGRLTAWKLDAPPTEMPIPRQLNEPTCLAFAPSGKLLAAAARDGIWLLDFDATAPVDRHPKALLGHLGPVRALAFAADSSFLASAGDDETVRLWDLATGKEEHVFKHGNGVRAVAVSPYGRWIAAGGADKIVYLWDRTTGEAVKLTGHTGTVNALAFSPDGGQLISGSSDRTIRIWDFRKKEELPGLDKLSAPVLGLAYHPGGRRFASLGQDKVIRLWDAITRQEILELEDPTGSPRAIAFSRDGRWLAAASGSMVRLWDSGKAAHGE